MKKHQALEKNTVCHQTTTTSVVRTSQRKIVKSRNRVDAPPPSGTVLINRSTLVAHMQSMETLISELKLSKLHVADMKTTLRRLHHRYKKAKWKINTLKAQQRRRCVPKRKSAVADKFGLKSSNTLTVSTSFADDDDGDGDDDVLSEDIDYGWLGVMDENVHTNVFKNNHITPSPTYFSRGLSFPDELKHTNTVTATHQPPPHHKSTQRFKLAQSHKPLQQQHMLTRQCIVTNKQRMALIESPTASISSMSSLSSLTESEVDDADSIDKVEEE